MPHSGCTCAAAGPRPSAPHKAISVTSERPRPAVGEACGYEHGSIILTTNRGIADWGHIFEGTTVAAAILDRLLHHATVLQIDGDSYRMRTHRARLQTLRTGLNHPSQGGEN